MTVEMDGNDDGWMRIPPGSKIRQKMFVLYDKKKLKLMIE